MGNIGNENCKGVLFCDTFKTFLFNSISYVISADLFPWKTSAANTGCEPKPFSVYSCNALDDCKWTEGMGRGIPIKSAVENGFLRTEKCVIHRRNLLYRFILLCNAIILCRPINGTVTMLILMFQIFPGIFSVPGSGFSF